MSQARPNISSPPRRVPLTTRFTNIMGGATQAGWFALGFGMIFFWGFVANADLSFLTFQGDRRQTTGVVSHSKETGASQNDTQVIANHYEYSVDGRSYTGVSYASGQRLQPGKKVTIEYLGKNPKASRIAGMRGGMFGPWAMLMTILPLIGVVVMYFTMKHGMRRNQLLRDGMFTTATLKEKKTTNWSHNNRRVYEMVFEFPDRRGIKHQTSARTSFADRFGQDHQEPILYDPEDPSRSLALDDLRLDRDFNEEGEIRGRPFRALMMLIIPAIVIAANSLPVLTRLGIDWWGPAVKTLERAVDRWS